MHRSTMQNLSFRNFKPGSWCITQSYLEEGICLCKNLEAVELHYYFSQQENPLLTVPLVRTNCYIALFILSPNSFLLVLLDRFTWQNL
jgi:hypothetical protein